MMPAKRSVDRTQSTRSGGFPRFNAVPPPTGVAARPRAAASASNAAISCGSPGTTTSGATTPSTTCGRFLTRPGLQGMDAELLSHRLHAQGADFSAHVSLREGLLRVEHPNRIEAVLETGHRGEIVGGVDQGHVPTLLGADTMLSREGPADVDAVRDDLFARLEHALGCAADAAIE